MSLATIVEAPVSPNNDQVGGLPMQDVEVNAGEVEEQGLEGGDDAQGGDHG